ncbi:hypothetical protein QBC36DRAFT_312833 [Triangularia setosa]|uniref:Uncharacterized protein n=1 Tax=Triangularia setosa TaxID=2587417 RepID=A0AAN6W381_9PEZI|nr:hypothetical protein QBC36DRAFT_312833 [Podospora setosa]
MWWPSPAASIGFTASSITPILLYFLQLLIDTHGTVNQHELPLHHHGPSGPLPHFRYRPSPTPAVGILRRHSINAYVFNGAAGLLVDTKGESSGPAVGDERWPIVLSNGRPAQSWEALLG